MERAFRDMTTAANHITCTETEFAAIGSYLLTVTTRRSADQRLAVRLTLSGKARMTTTYRTSDVAGGALSR